MSLRVPNLSTHSSSIQTYTHRWPPSTASPPGSSIKRTTQPPRRQQQQHPTPHPRLCWPTPTWPHSAGSSPPPHGSTLSPSCCSRAAAPWSAPSAAWAGTARASPRTRLNGWRWSGCWKRRRRWSGSCAEVRLESVGGAVWTGRRRLQTHMYTHPVGMVRLRRPAVPRPGRALGPGRVHARGDGRPDSGTYARVDG